MPKITKATVMCMCCKQPLANSAEIIQPDPSRAIVEFWSADGQRLQLLLWFENDPPILVGGKIRKG